MGMWSDGRDRPDWYDGTSLQRGIEDYFSKPRDEEAARLRTENAELRAMIQAKEKVSRARRGACGACATPARATCAAAAG